MRPQTSGFIAMETKLSAVRPEDQYQCLLAAVLEQAAWDYAHPHTATRICDAPSAVDGEQWADFKVGPEEVLESLLGEGNLEVYFKVMDTPLTVDELRLQFMVNKLGMTRDEARAALAGGPVPQYHAPKRALVCLTCGKPFTHSNTKAKLCRECYRQSVKGAK
jgi:hypothetical protein